MVVIDTSVWIDYFNDNPTSQTKILEEILNSDRIIVLPAIIYQEILQGIRSDQKFQTIKDLLDEFVFLPPLTKSTYLQAATIYRVCRKKGITIRKSIDCLIAATVIENGLSLLHNDSDFDKIAEVFELNIMTK